MNKRHKKIQDKIDKDFILLSDSTNVKFNLTFLKEESTNKAEFAKYVIEDLLQIINGHKTPSETKVVNAMIYQECSPAGMEPDFKIAYQKKSYENKYRMDLYYYGKRILFARASEFEQIKLCLNNVSKQQLLKVIENNFRKEKIK